MSDFIKLSDSNLSLNWIIEGAENVIANEDIFISDECRQFKEKFIKDTGSVALFLEAEGYTQDAHSTILLKTLYSEYKDFCHEDGYRTLGKTNFAKRLQAIGFERIKADGNKDYFKLCRKFKSLLKIEMNF